MRLAITIVACAVAAAAQDDCRPMAPCYTAEGVLNGASFTASAAPFTYISIFGTHLAWSERVRASGDALLGLGGVRVFIDDHEANVVYVSERQINALLPAMGYQYGSPTEPFVARQATVKVFRDSVEGPTVRVWLDEFAPAIFQIGPGTLAAVRYPGWRLATPEDPARPGEYVSIFLTGLGALELPVDERMVPMTAVWLLRRDELTVFLNGLPLDPAHITYIGCAPGNYGLYQMNIRLPEHVPTNPEIRVSLAGYTSPPERYMLVGTR